MTRDEIQAFLEARRQHWEARDPVRLASDHTDECTVQSPIFGSMRGRQAIEASYRELFKVFSDWTIDEDPAVIDGHRAVTLFTAHGTHTSNLFGVAPTGRRFEIHGVLMLTMRDGKIHAERRLYDFTSMLLQLGVIRAKPL
jgi:predicted ester cyclase